MTAKKAAQPAPEKAKNDTLAITQEDDKSKERQFAEIGLSPILGNVITANLFAKGSLGELDLAETYLVIQEEVKKVQDGDLSGIEATLTVQAITLDKIFIEMARRASFNMREYIPAMETYLKLALKAQTQCRTTLQTLAEIKNPQPVSFVKQANISHGPQQINNGVSPRAEKFKKQPNELLTEIPNETLDGRRTGEAISVNTELEALE